MSVALVYFVLVGNVVNNCKALRLVRKDISYICNLILLNTQAHTDDRDENNRALLKEEAESEWLGVLKYDAEITKFFIMLRTQTVVLTKDSSDKKDTHNFNTISITKHKATKTTDQK